VGFSKLFFGSIRKSKDSLNVRAEKTEAPFYHSKHVQELIFDRILVLNFGALRLRTL
jgi:hypothetical protein